VTPRGSRATSPRPDESGRGAEVDDESITSLSVDPSSTVAGQIHLPGTSQHFDIGAKETA
jgi:hypothetical protein